MTCISYETSGLLILDSVLFKRKMCNYAIFRLVAAATHSSMNAMEDKIWPFGLDIFVPNTFFCLFSCSWRFILYDLTFSGS